MERVVEMILRDIEDDSSINGRGVNVELSGQGFLKRRKSVRLIGSVDSEAQRQKIKRIAEHHAGEQYAVIDELSVKSPV
jgi:osmotically-inducible protein OsmY